MIIYLKKNKFTHIMALDPTTQHSVEFCFLSRVPLVPGSALSWMAELLQGFYICHTPLLNKSVHTGEGWSKSPGSPEFRSYLNH